MIVKRIYFPGATYSHNEKEFLKILKTFGLLWEESVATVYENSKKTKLLAGIYISSDKNKRIFAFYEGYEKPATLIVKILDGGGNFLIDLNSLCHNAGCVAEDVDEQYIENVILRLKKFGDIDIPGDVYKRKDREDLEISKNHKITYFDLILRRIVRRHIRRYVLNNGKSLIRRGIGMKVAILFKKKQMKNDAIWAMENGWIKQKM